MNKTFQYRLYPTKKQQARLNARQGFLSPKSSGFWGNRVLGPWSSTGVGVGMTKDLQRQVKQLEQWALVARPGQKTMTLTDIGSGAGRLYGLRSRKQKALLACAKQVLTAKEQE